MRYIPFANMKSQSVPTTLDAQYVYVTEFGSGPIPPQRPSPKYSSNSGTTYNTTVVSGAGTHTPMYMQVASSSSGQYVIYGVRITYDAGTYYTHYPIWSSDYGANAVFLNNTLSNWQSVAISNDGQYALTVGGIDQLPSGGATNRILKITNYGSTDVLDNLGGALTSTGALRPNSCAVSSTGQYQTVVGHNAGGGDDGKTWWAYSNNYGSTFTLVNPASYQAIPGYMSMSSTGQYQISSYSNFGSGYIFSNDYGQTFTQTILNPTGNTIGSSCMSSTGEYIYFVSNAGLYKSTNYGASFSIISSICTSSDNIKCSSNGSNVYLYHSNIIYRSINYGITFNPTSTITGNFFALSAT